MDNEFHMADGETETSYINNSRLQRRALLDTKPVLQKTFPGRKNEDVYKGDLNHLCGLLAYSIKSLVDKGIVEEEKLDSFNLPIYGPSLLDEVKTVVKQSGLFHISYIKLFESNWDPYDDSEGNAVEDSLQSGVNVAKSIRAVMEPLLANHFGESVLDELFKEYAHNVAEHLQKEKTMYSVIVLSLQKNIELTEIRTVM